MERYHMFKLGLAILFYAAYCVRPMLVSALRSSSFAANQTLRPEDYNVFYQGVDGIPGVDFPVLSFIPKTLFSCDGIESGYYADLDTDCQVFHICEEGKKISFLCPNGTIFEQADLICEWWYKVNCTNAPSLYQESAEFLREDIARRKASRRIALDGRERSHGAVMRIEESASVSAQQNGKPLRVGVGRGAVGGTFTQSTNSPSRSNLIQSAIGKDAQALPQKRYNDADTGNYLNDVNGGDSTRTQYSGFSSVTVEKQVYTRSTTPSSTFNLGETPSRKQPNNRGSVRFSSGFGSRIPDSQVSPVQPTTEAYELAFPTHRSEVTLKDYRPKQTSGGNTVKIDSSKVNLGQPKQQSTLTRNDILTRRLEPVDSDELQVPQETAAFSPSSYNSLQSNNRKFTTSPHPNHRPTYSDLKRPDFSSTKLVNPINSVTPQYITTQSINSGKPFVGVGRNAFRSSGKANQDEESIKPFSTTERTLPISTYQSFESSKLAVSTTQDGGPQQDEDTFGSVPTTERVPYTIQPEISSTLYNFDDGGIGSSTPRGESSRTQQNEGTFVPISTTEGAVPYTLQPVISSTYHAVYDNTQAFSSTPRNEAQGTYQNEDTTGPFSTTEKAIPYTTQHVASSTYQPFQGISQGVSSTPQSIVSSTASPFVESKTTRTIDHATVYGSFSRGPTTPAPPNGVEVKLGKNVDKISIQLSKSLGGEPTKLGSTLGPQLATDGFVRITAGKAQPVIGSASQVNLGTGSGRGNRPPSYPQSDKGITSAVSAAASTIGTGGIGSASQVNFGTGSGRGTRPPSYPQSDREIISAVPAAVPTIGTGGIGSTSQVNFGTGSGRGTRPPSYPQSDKEIISAVPAAVPTIGTGGIGIVGSTAIPNMLSLSEGATLNADTPLSSTRDGNTLLPLHITPEVRVNNIQSTTATPLTGTETSTAGNLEGFGNTGTPLPDGTTSQNGAGGSSSVTFNIHLTDGSTLTDLNNANTGSPDIYSGSTSAFGGVGSTAAPNVQISTGLSGSTVGGTVQPAFDVTGSTLVPNVEGSTLTPGYFGQSSAIARQPASGSISTSSPIVQTRISSSLLRNIIGGNGIATGGTGISTVPQVALVGATVEDSNTEYPSSSIRPNVYISEKSRNTVAPPVGDSFDYSTVSSRVTGSPSQVTETPLRIINGSDAHLNSYRPNFYPPKGKDTLAQTVTSPPRQQGSTFGESSDQRTPSPVRSFASNVQGTVPSSLRESIEINLSQNDIGSTLSPVEEVSSYRSTSTQQQSSYKTAKPDGPTGTGFFVTRNSYSSTTPTPFGLSKATTSGYVGSTPLVNISPNSGEEAALSSSAGDTLSRSETKYPRPFQKSPNSIDDDSSHTKLDSVTPTYFTYKISSARPFELPKDKVTPAPTIPTPFTTARSVQDNVDDMINTLKELVDSQDYSSETPRPGLVVPPSAGPQTLHTLAQYFANALDGIVAEREKETGEELDPESKEKLTSLLTQMTMYRYNELFKGLGPGSSEESDEATTPTIEDELEEGDSNNLVETPELRDLAKNFSLALAGYLNDPVAFRNELKTFRPTEPTTRSDELTESGVGDEELLNFSDADSKTSFNPPLPTPQGPSPTWGFIVAPKTSGDLDVKNSLNPDLHTADSQSFVPGFNNLAATTGKGIDKGVGTQKDVSGGHWTASPGVTKVWQSTFSVNPAILNENLETTRPISHTTESYVAGTTAPSLDFPQSEIQYDLRALPKLTLNSTQVHGILIDFVNTTKPDDTNRLQRLLKKLNTTEDEFLHRMKEIESNPLTKRLILLLISECGANVTKDLEADPIHSLSELLNSPSGDPDDIAGHQESRTVNSDIPELVDPHLQQDDQDTRALQLLNSLYAIASKFGK